MAQSMLTTTDNPFDPFTQFEEWRQYDEREGYNTCALLGRVANVSVALSPAEYDTEIENAIDAIVKANPLGIHVKKTKE